MKIQSAKAKGRRAAQEVREVLLRSSFDLDADDIIVTSSSVTGEDLTLSPKARKAFPFTIEVKNQEHLNIWSAIEQANAHALTNGQEPLVVFKRNKAPLRAIIDFDFLVILLEERQNLFRDLKKCHETLQILSTAT